MIESAFYSVMTGCPAITALAGSRIYPLVVPTDSPLPCLDYAIIGGASTPTLTTPGTSRWRVEVNAWGDNYSDAVTLRAAVIANLSGYADSTMSIQLISPQDFFDHELLQYRAMAEFYLYFTN